MCIRDSDKSASCVFTTKAHDVWCRVYLSTVSKAGDSPAFVVGIIEDITKEKSAELENVELQAIYDFTMNHDYEYLCIVALKKMQYAVRFSNQNLSLIPI